VLTCESDRRVKRKPLANKYKPIAWIANTQTRTIKLFIKVAGKNGEDQHSGVYSLLESPMSSYHIQDLRLVLPALSFDVRVNKHCAKVSVLFRVWLQELLHGDVARTEGLSDHRFDLLCSLCFPTIDPPQLLRVSKLCALTFLASDGHIRAETSPSQWVTEYVPHAEPVFKALNRSTVHSTSKPYPNFLNSDHFLDVAHSLRTRQAQESEHSTPPASGTNILLRVAGNLLSWFYSSRETNAQSPYPGLLEFLAVLRHAYDRELSEELLNVTLLTTLWRCATNIVVRSQVIRQMRRILSAGKLT